MADYKEIFGTLFNDSLFGTAANDKIFGLDGNDRIFAFAGNDLIFGGEGDDYLDGGDGSDTIYGENHLDTLLGGEGDDYLDGGNGKDSLYGGLGNDYLSGYNGKDLLFGEEGADFLLGGNGRDSLYGGSDNDTLLGEAEDDALFGGTGEDIIVGGEGDDVGEGNENNDLLIGEAGNDSLWGNSGNDTIYGGWGFDLLRGGTGSDYIAGNENSDRIYGEAGADNLDGGDGNDTINGGEGDDYLYGDVGEDALFGDAGNDTLIGAAGNDYLAGGSGNDGWLSGEAGNDTITGGTGSDIIDGGTGNDVLDGNEDDDYWINGNEGSDTVNGGAGNDVVDGGAGNDVVSGDAGNDTVIGNLGDDTLTGGIGNDLIYGDAGNDVFWGTVTNGVASIDLFSGGKGADTFILGNDNSAFYNDGNSSTEGLQDYAVLADFDRLEDAIQLYGTADLYTVASSPFNLDSAAIYFDSDSNGSHDELVAVFEHLSQQEVFLDSSYVSYSNSVPSNSFHPSNNSEWELVFSDEFDGTSLDLSKWDTKYYYGSRTNSFNNEEQYYLDDAFEFDNGVMSIVGQKLDTPIEAYEAVDRQLLTEQGKDLLFDYSSGMISGFERNAFTYGYLEISAKVDMGQSLWPAFWMLPTSGEWPPEIDIMEILNEIDPYTNELETNLYTTLHTADDSVPEGHYSQQSGYSGIDFSQDFHTFAAEWNADSITWYVDGTELFTVDSGITQEPMYLLANLAIGGDWPGATNENTPENSTFDIDYIRVYQNSQGTLHGGVNDDSLTRNNGHIAGETGNDNLVINHTGSLDGGDGNDTLTGGSGDNFLDGGDGNDVLTDSSGRDTFTGGSGKDRFILDVANSYRLTADYATIRDFNINDDVIQLSGTASNYVIGVSNGNSEIYWDSNDDAVVNSSDALVVVAKNAGNLDLSQDYFDFV